MNPPADATATVSFTLKGPDFEMGARVTVPAGPTTTAELLPLARGLADRMVSQSVAQAEAAGLQISCRKGCGACCCNLVAVSEVEARRIAEVVEEMPEPRRSEIRGRFAEAVRQLDAAGLLPILRRPAEWTDQEYANLVGDYFRARVPCPFLEEGACSIYDERPLTCREYLVVSPAELCANDDSSGVQRLRMLLPVFHSVARWRTAPGRHLEQRVVPLILAPEWAAAHPDGPPPAPGVELLKDLLELLKKPQSDQ